METRQKVKLLTNLYQNDKLLEDSVKWAFSHRKTQKAQLLNEHCFAFVEHRTTKKIDFMI